MYELSAVVKRHNLDLRDRAISQGLLRKTWSYLLDFFFDVLDYLKRILREACYYNATDSFRSRLI